MKQVIRYVADDGEMFETKQECISYEKFQSKLIFANEKFKTGTSLAEVLRFLSYNLLPESDQTKQYTEFESVTKDTLIAIPFWQCRDLPMYKVLYINKDFSLCVGNLEYSNTIYLHNFIRYLNYTNKNFK